MRKHFLIFSIEEQLIQITPRDWARDNQQYFLDHNFENAINEPTTNTIENYLIANLGFTMIADKNIVLVYNFN